MRLQEVLGQWDHRKDARKFRDAEQALEHFCELSPYLYDTEAERVAGQTAKLTLFVGRLVDLLVEKEVLTGPEIRGLFKDEIEGDEYADT